MLFSLLEGGQDCGGLRITYDFNHLIAVGTSVWHGDYDLVLPGGQLRHVKSDNAEVLHPRNDLVPIQGIGNVLRDLRFRWVCGNDVDTKLLGGRKSNRV